MDDVSTEDVPVYEAPPVEPPPNPETQPRRGAEPEFGGAA